MPRERATNYRSVEEWENRNTSNPTNQVKYDPEFDNNPTCPYCESSNFTRIKGGRYHCNNTGCFKSFSDTVGTEFHKRQVPIETLQKLKECYQEGISVREAAKSRVLIEILHRLDSNSGMKELIPN